MAIRGATIRSSLKNDAPFATALIATWIAFFSISECSRTASWSELALFAFWASFFSFAILRVLGYFDTLRLLPRKSDLILVMVAVPIGGVLQAILLERLFYRSVCPIEEVILWSPLIALGIFGAHNVYELVLLRRGKRRKIALDLLPEEAKIVVQDFEALGMHNFITFISRAALRRYIRVGRVSEISLVIISQKSAANFDVDGVLIRTHLSGVPIIDYRRAGADLMGKIRLGTSDLWSYLLEATPQTYLRRAYSGIKRLVEPIAALLLLILLAPILVIAAAAIRINSRGPILYVQKRTGYLGNQFRLFKFRSMRVDAEKDGVQWSKVNDPRVTRVGAFLRKTRIDELPQLINVLRGEMGFFGPRPERPEVYASLAPQIPLFAMRNIVRPGITGWAQVCAGYANSVDDSLEKLEFDLYYIKHTSLRLDLIILIKTISIFVRGLVSNDLPERSKSKENSFGIFRWGNLALRRLGMF